MHSHAVESVVRCLHSGSQPCSDGISDFSAELGGGGGGRRRQTLDKAPASTDRRDDGEALIGARVFRKDS